ncbi:MAG: hypothetical protein PHV30_03515 [Candidatus Margulisbacteria bacterium]|nr:hypothetical protein [Candidatus Margulisiibacteriota bacterium]
MLPDFVIIYDVDKGIANRKTMFSYERNIPKDELIGILERSAAYYGENGFKAEESQLQKLISKIGKY